MTLNVNKNNISATLQLIVTEKYAKYDHCATTDPFIIVIFCVGMDLTQHETNI